MNTSRQQLLPFRGEAGGSRKMGGKSPFELLVFFADTLKRIPPSLLEPYLKGQRQSMLMQSPTHAFLLKPFLSPFKEA